MKHWVVFTLLFSLMLPAMSLAGTVDDTVAGIAFTTSPQSVDPGVLSAMLTIEAQDAAGNPSNIGETGDLTFISTSPTAEFLNESGESVRTIMNNGTHSRNFYYRDSTAGSYTLTVTLTGRTSQRSWTATQNIGVGQAVEGGEDDNTDDTSSAGGSSTQSVSTASKKSTATTPLKVEIVKLPPAVVGSPLVFNAKVTGVNKDDKNGLLVHWSFGDGGEALGLRVYHAYQFTGKYVVVLSVRSAEEEATVRAVAEVGEPTLEISQVGYDPVPYLQLVNKTNKEIDLGTWQLTNQERSWNLPANTIIAPNAKLNLPVDPARLALNMSAAVSLVSPTGRVVASHGGMTASPTAPSPEQQTKISSLKSEVDRLVAQIDTIARRDWAAKQAAKAAVTAVVSTAPVVAETIPMPVAAAPTVIELPKKAGVLEQGWKKLKNAILR